MIPSDLKEVPEYVRSILTPSDESEEMGDKLIHPPEQSTGDAVHAMAKAAVSAIPVIGGPAAELLSSVITPPLTKRRAEWENLVAEKLRELEDKVEGFNIENLVGNESFVTAYLNATRIALGEHRREKLDALKNAVLNSALSTSPDDDDLALFFNYIDRFSPWHLRLLNYFHQNQGMYLTILIPDLRGREAFYGLLVDDLISSGLLFENTEALADDDILRDEYEVDGDGNLKIKKEYPSGTPKSARTLMSDRIRLKVHRAEITKLGRDFLSFITSPVGS